MSEAGERSVAGRFVNALRYTLHVPKVLQNVTPCHFLKTDYSLDRVHQEQTKCTYVITSLHLQGRGPRRQAHYDQALSALVCLTFQRYSGVSIWYKSGQWPTIYVRRATSSSLSSSLSSG